MYTTYEEPFQNEKFTLEQMKDIYTNFVNQKEYPDFECWYVDMIRSGVFEEV